jgi:hypothetical protein
MNLFLKRSSTLVILLLSLTWLCRAPGWDSLIAFIGALVAYLGLDLWQTGRNVSSHDRELADRLLRLLPPESPTTYLLRSHDLAVPFQYSSIKPLFELHDTWKGVGYEFDDKKLEKARKTLFAKLAEFVPMLAGETWPHERNPELVTMDFKDWDNPPEKIAIRNRLNTLGTEFLNEYGDFVRVIRSKRK